MEIESPKIQTSNDYDLFDKITGNRNLSQKKIERIISDIKSGFNLLPYCPVIVYNTGKKLMIIDGQHRFDASVKIGSPVYYVVMDMVDLRQIARMNSNQDKWSQYDFLRSYINLGIKDYVCLQETMSAYQINISVAIELLMNGKIGSRGDIGQKFRDGNFKVKYQEETEILLKLVKRLFGRYVFSMDRNLISAVQEISKKGLCDFDVLEEKISRNPMLMNKEETVKNYIYAIEKIYNHGNSIRKVIF